MRIYTLLGDAAYLDGAAFGALAERHAAMLEPYCGQNWVRARECLAECRTLDGALDKFYAIVTCFIVGLMSAGIFAFGAYAPSHGMTYTARAD